MLFFLNITFKKIAIIESYFGNWYFLHLFPNRGVNKLVRVSFVPNSDLTLPL